MKNIVVTETERVRLFFRKIYQQEKSMEMGNFPGIIVDNQTTKFSVCIKCCDVFSYSAINAINV